MASQGADRSPTPELLRVAQVGSSSDQFRSEEEAPETQESHSDLTSPAGQISASPAPQLVVPEELLPADSAALHATGSVPTYPTPRETQWAPLTHPNGTTMFPGLSTAEEEAMSAEALLQAQGNVLPDGGQIMNDNGSIRTASSATLVDSDYESDEKTSETTSTSSSVHDFMYENGRRFHSFREGRYAFPNDEPEQEREDMKHAMVKLLCHQKLHFAPLDPGIQHVLDIGTGTGMWAIEMGDRYPSAEVVGVDLSPIQPVWLPPNVQFVVDDVESQWLYPPDHFDYIHSRHTVMAIKDWRTLLDRSFKHLKPGGWFEMQEVHHFPMKGCGHPAPPSNLIAQYWSKIHEGLAAIGVNFHIVASGGITSMMRDVGFVNVSEQVIQIPLGTWPENNLLKTVGIYWRTILLDGLQAIALGPLTRGLRWSPEAVELFLVQIRRAYMEDTRGIYMPLHIICGQKPDETAPPVPF